MPAVLDASSFKRDAPPGRVRMAVDKLSTKGRSNINTRDPSDSQHDFRLISNRHRSHYTRTALVVAD